ncbi:hypothetical protein [Bosea sp. (in: a-proteobacteria)]|uniref:hypothetical protein n=1 Tax=Bosea sp. (in: a-proteobacteria) TaxID=1871050 RepID=UPI003F717F11
MRSQIMRGARPGSDAKGASDAIMPSPWLADERPLSLMRRRWSRIKAALSRAPLSALWRRVGDPCRFVTP